MVMNAIQAENVGIGVHFRAVHLHPYYAETFGFTRGMYPNAEYYSDRTISLPLYPKMTDRDADDVVAAVRKTILHFRR
jgi:UDP-4-amino-4-deoxy-L-arabinose-oxoglutarate aminotransferase